MAGWWWAVNGVITILFWGGLIALGVWMVRRFAGERVGRDSAEEILRRRLASGEISREEYEQLRDTIRS